MRILNFIGISSLTIAICTNLIACSKDDTQTVQDYKKKKLVKVERYGNSNSSFFSQEFEYDELGRVSKIISSEKYTESNEQTTTAIYVYTDNSIIAKKRVITNGTNSSANSIYNYIYELKDGKINNVTEKSETYIQNSSGEIYGENSSRSTLEYDNNHHLICQKLYYPPGNPPFIYTYKWKDDNLIEIEQEYPGGYSNTYSYTYTNIPYSFLGMNSCFSYSKEGHDALDDNMLFAYGYFGKCCKNLSNVSTYQTDNNGNVTGAAVLNNIYIFNYE